jgi:hypothetical protein
MTTSFSLIATSAALSNSRLTTYGGLSNVFALPTTFSYNVSVGSNLSVTGATTLSNGLSVSGDAIVVGTSYISGAATFSNTVLMSSNLTTAGDFRTAGAATLSNTVIAYGAATFSNTVLMSSNLTTAGAATLSNGLTVYGNTSFSNTINVSGALNVLGASLLSNGLVVYGSATTLSNATTVYGIATFSNAVVVSSNLSVPAGAALNVNGVITCTGNATFTSYGANNFSNVVSVASNLNVAGNVDIRGDARLSGSISYFGLGSQSMVTGGGVVTYTGDPVGDMLLKWTARCIVIPVAYSSDGYYIITCPTTSIKYYNRTSTATTKACLATGGVYISEWSALYYVIDPAANSPSLDANFVLVYYGPSMTVPVNSNWILIACRQSDTGHVLKWLPGQVAIPVNGTYTSSTCQSSWTAGAVGATSNVVAGGTVTTTSVTTIGDVNVGGKLYVGSNTNAANGLYFAGTPGDVGYSRIINRNYDPVGGTAIAPDYSELLLFQGNDAPTTGADRIRYLSAQHKFQVYGATVGPGDTATFWADSNYTTAMTINNSGNIGIGTSNPTFKLNVEAGSTSISSGVNGLPATTGATQSALVLRLRGADNAVMDFGANSANGTWIQSADRNSLQSNYPLMLNPNGGNVGIGKTVPAYNLDVAGSVGCGTLTVSDVIRTTNTSFNKKLVLYDDNAAENVETATAFYGFGINASTLRYQSTGLHKWYSTTTNTMTLDGTGNLTCTANITAYSDARLKDDIRPIADSLSKIDRIGGYTYTRNDIQGGDSNVRYAGVLAHEVREVLPEVVHENSDGYLSVSYGNMVALLVEGIKELNGKLAEVQTTVADQGGIIVEQREAIRLLSIALYT